MTTCIGLDLGSNCGWAIVRDGAVISSDTRHFERGLYGYGHLFDQFRKLLVDLHESPCVWAYEEPHFRGGPPTRITVGMAGHLLQLAHHWGEPCRSIHTGSLKKWATGSGRASKAAMMTRARLSTTCEGEMTEHEADAILVALWVWEVKQTEEE